VRGDSEQGGKQAAKQGGKQGCARRGARERRTPAGKLHQSIHQDGG
jgi:hypothetical protein